MSDDRGLVRPGGQGVRLGSGQTVDRRSVSGAATRAAQTSGDQAGPSLDPVARRPTADAATPRTATISATVVQGCARDRGEEPVDVRQQR